MTQEKSSRLSHAATAASTMLIVLSLVSIDNSRLGILHAKQETELANLSLDSISPENLAKAPESLRLRIVVEDRDFPVKELMQLPAWTTLQTQLSGYAERMKLMRSQQREIGRQLSLRHLWTAIAALVAAMIGLLVHRRIRSRARQGS
jgi:hypothetical protein